MVVSPEETQAMRWLLYATELHEGRITSIAVLVPFLREMVENMEAGRAVLVEPLPSEPMSMEAQVAELRRRVEQLEDEAKQRQKEGQ